MCGLVPSCQRSFDRSSAGHRLDSYVASSFDSLHQLLLQGIVQPYYSYHNIANLVLGLLASTGHCIACFDQVEFHPLGIKEGQSGDIFSFIDTWRLVYNNYYNMYNTQTVS